jgi:hypothetical protein
MIKNFVNFGSLNALISKKSLCDTALILESAQISLLYGLNESDADQLLMLCKTDQHAVDYWMRFLPKQAKMFESFFELCQLDVEVQKELIKTKALNINRKLFDHLCGMKFSKNEAKKFENEIFNFVPELLDDVFDWKKVCLSKKETQKEIVKVILGGTHESFCKFSVNAKKEDKDDRDEVSSDQEDNEKRAMGISELKKKINGRELVQIFFTFPL